jgi:hypothetical protein
MNGVCRLGGDMTAVETVNHDQLVECLGHRPFKSDAYLQFLHHTSTANAPPSSHGILLPPAPAAAWLMLPLCVNLMYALGDR